MQRFCIKYQKCKYMYIIASICISRAPCLGLEHSAGQDNGLEKCYPCYKHNYMHCKEDAGRDKISFKMSSLRFIYLTGV